MPMVLESGRLRKESHKFQVNKHTSKMKEKKRGRGEAGETVQSVKCLVKQAWGLEF